MTLVKPLGKEIADLQNRLAELDRERVGAQERRALHDGAQPMRGGQDVGGGWKHADKLMRRRRGWQPSTPGNGLVTPREVGRIVDSVGWPARFVSVTAAPHDCGAVAVWHLGCEEGYDYSTSRDRRGAVAQLGERCNRTAEVRGSIPLSSIVFLEN